MAAIGVAVVVWLLLASFPGEQRAVGTVFAVTIILWATEAFPVGVTALGGMVLLALFGGIGEARAFAGLGDPIIALFIGSLIIASAFRMEAETWHSTLESAAGVAENSITQPARTRASTSSLKGV